MSSPSASEDDLEEDAIERREREWDRERYGVRYARQEADVRQEADARRRERKQDRADRRRRKMDKKVKRRQKEAERTYALYLQCVPPVDDRL